MNPGYHFSAHPDKVSALKIVWETASSDSSWAPVLSPCGLQSFHNFAHSWRCNYSAFFCLCTCFRIFHFIDLLHVCWEHAVSVSSSRDSQVIIWSWNKLPYIHGSLFSLQENIWGMYLFLLIIFENEWKSDKTIIQNTMWCTMLIIFLEILV